MREKLKDHLTKDELLFQLPSFILGAEEVATEDEGSQGGDGTGEPNQAAEGEQEPNKDTSGLKSALNNERKLREDAEKELKKLKKAEADRKLAEMAEIDQAKAKEAEAVTRAEAAEQKLAKLTEGFALSSVRSVIEGIAKDMKFIDPSDAIEGVDITQIEYIQDDEDPTKVTIDKKKVETLVKSLAAKKPYFIATGTNDGLPSGSQFGGNGGGKNQDQEKTYRERYPSL